MEVPGASEIADEVASGLAGSSDAAVAAKLRRLLANINTLLANNNTRSGFPVTRRSVMAMLASHLLGAGKWGGLAAGLGRALHGMELHGELHGGSRAVSGHDSNDAASLMHQVVVGLYQLHVRGMARRGLLNHMHVSKSAGTTLCTLSARNGCRTRDSTPVGNCIVRGFDDKPRWVSKKEHRKLGLPMDFLAGFVREWPGDKRSPDLECAARADALRKRNWTYFANEYYAIEMHPEASAAALASWPAGAQCEAPPPGGLPGLCTEFASVLICREPLERIISNMQHIVLLYQEKLMHYQYHRFYGQMSKVQKYLSSLPLEVWRALAPAVLDNMYIRSLLGELTYDAPVGSLTAGHLSVARRHIASVDVLLDLGHTRAADAGVSYGLGWKYGLADEHQRVLSTEGGGLSSGSRTLRADASASSSASDSDSDRSQQVDSGGCDNGGCRRLNDGPLQFRLWQSVPPELALANALDVQLYATARALSLLDAMVFAYVASTGEAVAPVDTGCGLLNQ
ncbi:hypothetical protein FOA52_002942 [Chlamydomonas sp. UWO 241]|nr:hypothetical protein FOA52_002942 [Chlamydomonas sp. UWO 241]